MTKQIKFDFGIFEYREITLNSIPIIKGRFSLNINPNFPKEFKKHFWFYDLTKRLKIDEVISLGPYYPQRNFKSDLGGIPNLKYPAFSDILFNSKSGPLHRIRKNFIIESRKQQLKIISNFYANYLKNIIGSLNYDEIIHVPAKLEYSYNSVEIISAELSNLFNIPMNISRIARIDDYAKEFSIIYENDNLNQKRVLLIDDIITDGETKDKIFFRLKEKRCNNIDMITLARTDHNIYEYNE